MKLEIKPFTVAFFFFLSAFPSWSDAPPSSENERLFSLYIEHIEYYGNAFETIRQGYRICQSRLNPAPSSDADAGKEKAEREKAKQLLKNYVTKMVEIQKKLAEINERLAEMRLRESSLEEASVRFAAATANWESIAEIHCLDAVQFLELNDSFEAGIRFELGFQAIKTAQSKWCRRIAVDQTVKSGDSGQSSDSPDVEENVKRLFYTGIEILKSASDAYTTASQQNLTQAKREKVSASTLSPATGDGWLKAAKASESSERINQLIRSIEADPSNTYSLDAQ